MPSRAAPPAPGSAGEPVACGDRVPVRAALARPRHSPPRLLASWGDAAPIARGRGVSPLSATARFLFRSTPRQYGAGASGAPVLQPTRCHCRYRKIGLSTLAAGHRMCS
ncbi:unnamed protein product [Urochloa humidicola]